MGERQNYTMTQADYDQLIERIDGPRKVSGMFLSGGAPMGDVQQAANFAWQELGGRMGFDGMSVRPGASKLQFSAMPAVATASADAVCIIPNCGKRAPAAEPFCADHRDSEDK